MNPVDTSDITAIELNVLKQPDIYPNPANTHIRFALKASYLHRKDYSYIMLNQLGQIVKGGALEETDQGEFRIVTDAVRGFYYLRITDTFQENT